MPERVHRERRAALLALTDGPLHEAALPERVQVGQGERAAAIMGVFPHSGGSVHGQMEGAAGGGRMSAGALCAGLPALPAASGCFDAGLLRLLGVRNIGCGFLGLDVVGTEDMYGSGYIV